MTKISLSRTEAESLLAEAARLNPGLWVQHSQYVAQGAQRIAVCHPRLDDGAAYILGLLHDIGRREGVTDMRHALDGYHFLLSLGYADAARVCLTHSFPIPFVSAGAGQWDASSDEVTFVQECGDYPQLNS